MIWRIEFKETAAKELRKLDRTAQVTIARFLRERVAAADNPRHTGKALTGDKRDLWRYRLGNYRIICSIEDEIISVLVLKVGHRKDVYAR